MKKVLSLIVCIMAALTLSAAPQRVGFDKLPKNSQEFVQKYMAGETIKYVEMDREASWDKYTVYFDSGNQVSFEGGSGDCSQIIMKKGYIPVSILPKSIATYITTHNRNANIVKMETTTDGYHLGLSDGTDLSFDKNGDFIKATK